MTARGVMRARPGKDEVLVAFTDYLAEDKEEIGVLRGDQVKIAKAADDTCAAAGYAFILPIGSTGGGGAPRLWGGARRVERGLGSDRPFIFIRLLLLHESERESERERRERARERRGRARKKER